MAAIEPGPEPEALIYDFAAARDAIKHFGFAAATHNPSEASAATVLEDVPAPAPNLTHELARAISVAASVAVEDGPLSNFMVQNALPARRRFAARYPRGLVFHARFAQPQELGAPSVRSRLCTQSD